MYIECIAYSTGHKDITKMDFPAIPKKEETHGGVESIP